MRFTKFTGAVVAGSIALSSVFAAPAFAASDGDKIATILLGAAAIGLIVSAANRSKHQAVVTRGNTYGHRDNWAYYKPRPKTCLRKKYTRHGWKTFYSRHCLAKHNAHPYAGKVKHKHNKHVVVRQRHH